MGMIVLGRAGLQVGSVLLPQLTCARSPTIVPIADEASQLLRGKGLGEKLSQGGWD